jgi:tetratricopeptide (TPR) repeat protein
MENIQHDNSKEKQRMTIIGEVNSLKLKGNQYFNQKEFVKAIKYYNKALELDDGNLIILSNRSECFLKLGLFESALSDCNKILESDSTNLKALYRKGRALENLDLRENLEEAVIIYKKIVCLLKEDGSLNDIELSKIIEERLQKTESKIKNTVGEFQLQEIYEEEKIILNRLNKSEESDNSINYAYTDLSCANYINNKLTLSFNPNKGMNFLANQDINQGELLIVEKPIVWLMSDEYENILKYAEENKLKLTKMDEDFEIYEILLKKITVLLKYLSETAKLIKNLSILYNNKNLNQNIEEREKNFSSIKESEIEDELRNIISYNSIVTIRNQNSFEIKEVCYGIWKNFSFLNHSCVPNAFYFGIGPYLIVKAIKKIKKGDEVTISYIEPKPFLERQFSLQKWEFVCNCDLCLIEKNIFETERYKWITKKMEKTKIKMYDNKILSYGDLKRFFENFNENNLKLIKKFEKWTENALKRGVDRYCTSSDMFYYIEFLFFKSIAIIFSYVQSDGGIMKDLKENKMFLFEKAIRLIEDYSIRETYELIVTLRDSMKDEMSKLKLIDVNNLIESLHKILYEF